MGVNNEGATASEPGQRSREPVLGIGVEDSNHRRSPLCRPCHGPPFFFCRVLE